MYQEKTTVKRLIVLVALLVALVSVTTAQEPLEIGSTVEGSLENNMGVYTFSARAQELFLFTLSSDDFDPFLQVESADGDVLASDDDSGEGYNARVTFLAPEAGEYSVVVRGFGGNATGAYLLTSSNEAIQLGFDEPQEVELPENDVVLAYFIAEAGEVVTVRATAGDGVDTNLILNAPDGSQVASNEDYEGLNPVIDSAILQQTGLHTVILGPYSDDDFGPVTLLVEKIELTYIQENGISLTFEDDGTWRKVLGLTVEADRQYEVALAFDKATTGSVELRTLDEFGSTSYFSFSNTEGVRYLYRAPVTGIIRVEVTNSSLDFPVTYSISVTPLR